MFFFRRSGWPIMVRTNLTTSLTAWRAHCARRNSLKQRVHSSHAFPAALVGLIFAATAIQGCVTTAGGQNAVLRAKDKVAPALVHIRPVKEVFTRGQRREVPIIGSGFITSPDGFVVTNEHVAGESTFVRCVLGNKEEVEAEVVGVDPYTDIAVLKLDVDHPLPYVAWGDSDLLEAGETVLALGSPHGLDRSVSLGIVSVTDRHLPSGPLGDAPFNNWIQTDAAINPGNSGGPLVNLRGQVVGVNTRKMSGADNLGFAIPTNVAREVAEAIIKHGRVPRSALGLTFQEMLARTEDPEKRGVVIADVDPLSNAARANVRPRDILLAINGHKVHARFEEDLPAVEKFIADLPIGEPAVLKIERGDEVLEASVVTVERSNIKGDSREFEEWGFTATELTPEIVRRAQLPNDKGVLVSGAQVGGIAAKARLGANDIILKVDGEEVENLSQFSRLYKQRVADKRPMVMLFVKKGALTRYILVKQDALESDDTENQ